MTGFLLELIALALMLGAIAIALLGMAFVWLLRRKAPPA
jgi:hypothetical protein